MATNAVGELSVEGYVEAPTHERQLGLPMATALVVGNIIGAGIFLLPAVLAPFGFNAIYGWLVAVGGSMFLAATLGMLSLRIDGGPFAYVRRAFGPEISFLVMWSYLVSIWTANATISIAAISNFSHITPSLGAPIVAPLSAIALVWILTMVNATGARNAGMIQLVTTLLKAAPLIAVVIVAAIFLGRGIPAASQAITPISGGSIASVAALALFSMVGFESASVSCDKIKDPGRNVPISSVFGAALTGIIYIAATWAVFYLLPVSKAATSHSPFADAILPLLGPVAGSAIALFATISAVGALNGWILCSGEVPLKLARDGVFPTWFGKTTRVGTPVRAQFLAAIAATVLIGMNYTSGLTKIFALLTLISVCATSVLYTACSLAALYLLAKRRLSGTLLATCAAVGLLFSIWTYWGAGLEATLWGLALIASGIPIWLLVRFSRRTVSLASPSPETAAKPAAPRE